MDNSKQALQAVEQVWDLLHEERSARLKDMTEIRLALSALKLQTGAKEDHEATDGDGVAVANSGAPASNVPGVGDVLEALRSEVADERDDRCRQQAAMMARLDREVADERDDRCRQQAAMMARLDREVASACRMCEDFRSALDKGIQDVADQLLAARRAMDMALTCEREERGRDYDEVKATLESVWQRIEAGATVEGMILDGASAGVASEKMVANREFLKEAVGKSDDMDAAYELIRELFAETMRISARIKEEATTRDEQVKVMLMALQQNVPGAVPDLCLSPTIG